MEQKKTAPRANRVMRDVEEKKSSAYCPFPLFFYVRTGYAMVRSLFPVDDGPFFLVARTQKKPFPAVADLPAGPLPSPFIFSLQRKGFFLFIGNDRKGCDSMATRPARESITN